MGQTHTWEQASFVETEGLLASEDEKPPDPKPPRKIQNHTSTGAKLVELKLMEHRAGAHPLVMVSCVH